MSKNLKEASLWKLGILADWHFLPSLGQGFYELILQNLKFSFELEISCTKAIFLKIVKISDRNFF